jgi:hypothetical protein
MPGEEIAVLNASRRALTMRALHMPEFHVTPAPAARSSAAPADTSGAAPARAVPLTIFMLALAALLAVAAVSVLVPTVVVEGLPADPSARAARDLLAGRVMPQCGGLRFRSAFLGDLSPGPHLPRPDPALISSAQMLLERARIAHPLEPRVVAALGHLELVRRRLPRAEALYRHAIELRAHCTEARLGLGLALALEADTTSDPFARRALQLEALAQFTAVGARSENALPALYDRVRMLENVGRETEAKRSGAEYLARDSTSVWAMRLRGEIADAR